jgi:acetyl-CoA acetyltransferase family protein
MTKLDPDRTLALVAGVRTPFARMGTDLANASAADLATHVFREVLDRTGFDPAEIDEVILGCAGPDAREANVARVAALRAGVPTEVPALTVMRNCASGMEAVALAATKIAAGEGSAFLVGGAESMSGFPLIYNRRATEWFGRLAKARTLTQRAAAFLAVRPSMFAPRIAIKDGLTDPISGLMMGDTAENLARRFAIDRSAQDAFAVESHRRAAAAREQGVFGDEIAPFAPPPKFRAMVAEDNGIRPDSSVEKLGKLKPVFDRREGDVTVGNACQVTDGAVGLLVTSLARARALGLEPLAIVRAHATAALDPAVMGLGPAFASPRALERAGLTMSDIGLVEINEAFAAQVLACQQAFDSKAFAANYLGRGQAVGAIDPAKLNVHGGAIALGHPIAASGARLLLTLALAMRRRGERFGLATLCVGGGQGEAVILEAA